jgi:hypothetical protein
MFFFCRRKRMEDDKKGPTTQDEIDRHILARLNATGAGVAYDWRTRVIRVVLERHLADADTVVGRILDNPEALSVLAPLCWPDPQTHVSTAQETALMNRHAANVKHVQRRERLFTGDAKDVKVPVSVLASSTSVHDEKGLQLKEGVAQWKLAVMQHVVKSIRDDIQTRVVRMGMPWKRVFDHYKRITDLEWYMPLTGQRVYTALCTVRGWWNKDHGPPPCEVYRVVRQYHKWDFDVTRIDWLNEMDPAAAEQQLLQHARWHLALTQQERQHRPYLQRQIVATTASTVAAASSSIPLWKQMERFWKHVAVALRDKVVAQRLYVQHGEIKNVQSMFCDGQRALVLDHATNAVTHSVWRGAMPTPARQLTRDEVLLHVSKTRSSGDAWDVPVHNDTQTLFQRDVECRYLELRRLGGRSQWSLYDQCLSPTDASDLRILCRHVVRCLWTCNTVPDAWSLLLVFLNDDETLRNGNSTRLVLNVPELTIKQKSEQEFWYDAFVVLWYRRTEQKDAWTRFAVHLAHIATTQRKTVTAETLADACLENWIKRPYHFKPSLGDLYMHAPSLQSHWAARIVCATCRKLMPDLAQSKPFPLLRTKLLPCFESEVSALRAARASVLASVGAKRK